MTARLPQFQGQVKIEPTEGNGASSSFRSLFETCFLMAAPAASILVSCMTNGIPTSSTARAQNIAIGLTGDPVALGSASGVTVSMNSQRLRDAAASLNAS